MYQVRVYLVEEPSLDALLHDARGTHADVLVACDRLRLLYGAFESVRDERKRGSFVDPLLWDRAAENKDRHVQRVFATPPVGEVERPSTEHQRPCRFASLCEELGGLCRDHEDHVGSRQPVFGVASGVPGQEPLAADSHGCFWAVIRPTYEPVKRDGEPCADFAHARSPSSPNHALALVFRALPSWPFHHVASSRPRMVPSSSGVGQRASLLRTRAAS